MSIVRSAFRQITETEPDRRPALVRSEMDGLAIGDQDLTFPPVSTEQRKFCRPRMYRLYAMEMKASHSLQGGPGPKQSHKLLKVGSTPIPATK